MSQSEFGRRSPAGGAAGSAARRGHMARSSLLVMGAFVLSKIVGLLRERAVAHAFGATPELDAYVAAFRVPDLLFTLLAGGALISAFLPVFADALAREDEEAAWELAGGITNLAFLATAVLGGLAAIAAPWLIETIIAPDFDPEQQRLAAELMRIVLISTLVFSVSGLQMGILNAFQHFLTPAIAPIVYNLGILFGALFLAPGMDIQGLAWGAVIGALGHLLVKLPSLLRRGYRYRPTLGLGRRDLRQVLWLMWPRVLGLGTVHVIFIVQTNLASGLPGGSLAALNYAWVLAQMPQTILGTAIATVAFPTLAELAARGDREGLSDTALGALRIMLALSLPAAVALAMLGGPAIAILLQTGRFGQEAADATLLALRMFALGLAGHVAFEIVARMFYAQKDTLTVLYIATAAMVVNIALALWWVEPLAQGGLALANSVAVTIEVLLGLWILHRRLGGIGLRRLAVTTGKAALASAAMALAIFGSLQLAPWLIESLPVALTGQVMSSPLLSGLITAGLGGAIGAMVYVVVGLLIGLEPLFVLWSRVRGRGRG